MLENLCEDIVSMLETNYNLYYEEEYDKESFVTEITAYMFNHFVEEE